MINEILGLPPHNVWFIVVSLILLFCSIDRWISEMHCRWLSIVGPTLIMPKPFTIYLECSLHIWFLCLNSSVWSVGRILITHNKQIYVVNK